MFKASVSHAPQPSIGVTGTQESPCIELVLCHYTHARTHTHTHTRQTHPRWNKHNPPAPLSWVTLPKRNNNDRQRAGWRCVSMCVCFMRGHTLAHTSTHRLLYPLPGDLQLFGWRVEVRMAQRRPVMSLVRATQLSSFSSEICVHWMSFNITVSILAA